MAWNPELYSQYSELRNKPFFDLLDLIEPQENMRVIDLGCGTGEQTAILKKKLPKSQVLGVDSSTEMLSKTSLHAVPGLEFRRQDIRQALQQDATYDLIFSNAALQWLDDHSALIPKIIARIAPQGQLAVQMPVQKENTLNMILTSLADRSPYSAIFQNAIRESPVLSIDQYAQLFFDHGLTDIHITMKMYPQIANSRSDLYDFIAGSALQQYLDRLTGELVKDFVTEFYAGIQEYLPEYPAIYPFKRLLLYGRRP